MRIATLTLCLLVGASSLRAQDSVPGRPLQPGSGDSMPSLTPRLGATLQRAPGTQPLGPMYEVDQVPTVDSIQAWYWPKGKVGHKATVVLQGVVDTTGRIEPETIRVLKTSDTAFVAAARLTFMVVYFRPGRSRGRPVRVLVQQGLAFGVKGHWCELKGPTPLLPPKCY
jgi:hypothetical protein